MLRKFKIKVCFFIILALIDDTDNPDLKDKLRQL